jgi:hypothetical protein
VGGGGGPLGGGGQGPGLVSQTTGGGQGHGLVSQTTGAGQVYVALTRYLQAGEEKAAGAADVIAVILESAVSYEDGKLSFLVRCSYAGDGRVVLKTLDRSHKRVKLGEARFSCAREGDDPLVSVPISASGRRLLEGSTRLRISARVIPDGSQQTFVVSP